MEKKKIFCIKCGKEINEKDNYVALFEYFGGEINRETYYHKNCLDKDKRKKEFLTAAIAGMAAKANKLMSRIENE